VGTQLAEGPDAGELRWPHSSGDVEEPGDRSRKACFPRFVLLMSWSSVTSGTLKYPMNTLVDMSSAVAIQRLERIVTTRDSVDARTATVADLEAGLAGVCGVRAFLDAAEAAMVAALELAVSFPESTIAETSRDSLGAASRTIERSNTLDAAPELAAALDAAAITAGHVDALTRAAKGLDHAQREQLVATADGLTDVAAVASVEQFSRRLRNERKTPLANGGIDRLEQQRRAVSMRT
jgi:hypothetical protein